jgi:hypothetical protein
MSRYLTLELAPVVNGVQWALYSVEFKTADGTFGTYIYAVSDEHAQAILTDLKDNAAVVGRLVGVAR